MTLTDRRMLTASKEEIDAAKRLSDIINSLVVVYPLDVLTHSWIAVRLSDGGYDGVLYDSRRDAVRHQKYEKECAYVQLTAVMGGMPVKEAFAFLDYYRGVYATPGASLPDPEAPNGGTDLITPLTIEDMRSAIRRLHNRRRKVR